MTSGNRVTTMIEGQETGTLLSKGEPTLDLVPNRHEHGRIAALKGVHDGHGVVQHHGHSARPDARPDSSGMQGHLAALKPGGLVGVIAVKATGQIGEVVRAHHAASAAR